MASKPKALKPSPEDTAGVLSLTFFSWVSPLLALARKKRRSNEELEDHEVWDLPTRDHTTSLTRNFDENWRKHMLAADRKAKIETAAGKPTTKGGAVVAGAEEDSRILGKEIDPAMARTVLYKTLKSLLGSDMKKAGVMKLFNSSVQFAYPLMISGILTYIQAVSKGDGDEVVSGWYYVGGLALAASLKAILENHYFYYANRAGWQARSAITTAVYRKSLRLTTSSRQARTVGEIVNIMQLDSTKIELFMGQLHVVWDGLFQIFGYMVILYTLIGWACFVGLAVMLFAIPVQMVVMQRLMGLNRKMVKFTDQRVKVSNEALQGILGVKMAAWEENFVEMINDYRRSEYLLLRRSAFYRAFSSAYMMAVPALTSVASLVVYAVTNDTVDAATLFAAVSAFGQLRFPLMFYPMALAQFVQARVSHGRIASFMALEEVHDGGAEVNDDVDLAEDTKSIDEMNKKDSVSLSIVDGEFYWANPDSRKANPDDDGLKSKKEKKKDKKKEMNKKGGKKESTGSSSSTLKDQTSSVPPVLTNINVVIPTGKLTAVVGSVASGKTSLCNALLGELHRSKGKVTVKGSVAYAAQSPWILNATLRDNILFGNDFDESRYTAVLKACQLTHDLDVLQDGDMTMIGERGINLSGGQKARVSIARATYSYKDIVILDDPLSALDPEVARKLFKECLVGFLRGRTVLLATNQLEVLRDCDKVICLGPVPASAAAAAAAINNRDSSTSNDVDHVPDTNDEQVIVNVGVTGSTPEYVVNTLGDDEVMVSNTIVEQGTYKQLVESGLDFAALAERFNGDDARAASTRQASTGGVEAAVRRGSRGSRGSDGSGEGVETEASDKKARENEAPLALMTQEERSKGAVASARYWDYVHAGGGVFIFMIVFGLFVLNQSLTVLNSAWLTLWTDDVDYENQTMTFYLVGYALVAVVLAIFSFIRVFVLTIVGLKASSKLHEKLLHSVLSAPMSFFDTVPIGRIISRFSKDVFAMDNNVPQSMNFFIFTALFVVFSLGTIAYVTPIFLAAVPVLGFVYYMVLGYYRPVVRDLKRMESISRSPVYAHFSETLGGLSTIRAFSESNTFMGDNATKVDGNVRHWYALKAIERWLSIRLEFLGSTVSILAATISVASASSSSSSASAGLVGLSLTFAFSITGLLNGTVRSFSELEAGMNSVERITYYATEIPQEAPKTNDFKPPEGWPRTGDLDITNLRMRYRPTTPLVIKGIDLSIKGGQRVGVVGRTGSGKSSLMLCLMRLVEPERDPDSAGPITFDGVDTTKLGLHDLRRNISIVPQNPVLFSGTIRRNLDPFAKCNEADVWGALDKCDLKTTVMQLPGKLDHEVSEYGDNFSAGQRQLLCLARAMLQNTRVLLLDEATSSVDFDTDQVVQDTIRASFQDTTILTIAHRINTVIDNDRILVLDDGNVAEYDRPIALLSNPKSALSKIVGKSRAGMLARLREVVPN